VARAASSSHIGGQAGSANESGALEGTNLKAARILIVDDEPANVALLERMLEQEGYSNVTGISDSSRVVELCSRAAPDLVLLDLHMPEPNGFEVMALLRPLLEEHWFPILVLTADVTAEAKRQALAGGAKDFVTKPFDRTEVLLRIKNLLEVRALQLELRNRNLMLEQRVHERSQDLSEARLEVLERLALAAEYRDDDTGEHTRRVGRTSALLARALGLSEESVELIRHAAPLHDVGKIGIPDRVLLKEGKLTREEFIHMTSHVNIGRFILSGSRSPLLQMAEEIAFTHHEWWNGAGYLSGLSGTEIPLAGRIVAVADVFDALTHDRPYKRAWSIEETMAEIRMLRGQQFDPEVVEAFETLDHRSLLSPVTITPPQARVLAGVR
jgi:putative two-component system response regulator